MHSCLLSDRLLLCHIPHSCKLRCSEIQYDSSDHRADGDQLRRGQHTHTASVIVAQKLHGESSDSVQHKISRRNVKWQVGLVFQYPEHQLFEETVYQDIAFGPRNMKLSDSEVDERVREAADFVGVDEKLFDGSPLELSGGQKRRVAIAGVIAMRPGVLILDEPTAGLDPAGCRQIMDNIRDYRERTGSTVIVVSHSMDDVARFTERLIVFDHSHVVMDGTPAEVFSQPEKLCGIGLAVPQATRIAMALKARGIALPESIYTYEQLKAALLELKGVDIC